MDFSHRDVPWIKAGVSVIDQAVTAAEAAELAGLDFDVELWPLAAIDPKDLGRSLDVSDRFGVVRQDTHVVLSVVGSKYEPLQYSEAFDFIDTVNPRYVAAGVRRGGREGYMVVQAVDTPNVKLLDGDDEADLYLVLRTSHDGSKKVEVAVMPLRGRCVNMMVLHGFASGAPHRWGIRHTSTMREKLAEASLTLAHLDTYVRDLEETVRNLADVSVKMDDVRRMFEWVLPDRPRRDESVAQLMELYQHSPTNGYEGTGWGVVNALTEWLDWQRPSKSADARFIHGLAGYSYKTTNRVAARMLTRGR